MSAEITKQDKIDEILESMSTELVEAEHPEGIEMSEWAFTNDKTNPAIRQLFHMLYNSAFANKLGVMHAKVKGKDEIQTIIVGVEVTPDGIATWPLAKILTEQEQSLYEAPDGNGNYVQGI